MTPIHKKLTTLMAILAAAAVPVAIAQGASSKVHTTKKHHAKKRQANGSTTSTSSSDAHRAAETPLTGDTKTSAENAAVAANPGATVQASSSEDPAENTGAAYEVKITKSDGTRAEVLEDSSFTVLSTKADDHGGRGPHGDHHGGPGGNPNEPALTGDEKSSAEAAALAAVPGGTVERSSKEDAGENTGAAYEVHVTKSDGSEVEVLEDSSFKVIATNAHQGRPHDGGRPEGDQS